MNNTMIYLVDNAVMIRAEAKNGNVNAQAVINFYSLYFGNPHDNAAKALLDEAVNDYREQKDFQRHVLEDEAHGL